MKHILKASPLLFSYKYYQTQKDQDSSQEILNSNPFKVFQQWIQQAEKIEGQSSTSFCLSTIDESNKPKSRMLGLLHSDEAGFDFCTNQSSKKIRQMQQNPNVAMNFYWKKTSKQIRIQGKAERIQDERKVEEYFQNQRRSIKIQYNVQKMSQPLGSQEELENELKMFEESNKDNEEIKKPDCFLCYKIRPYEFEFWQNKDARLHDRVVFRKKEQKEQESWFSERLFP